MSKKHKPEVNETKMEPVEAVVFEVGQVVKATQEGTVVFMGEVKNIADGRFAVTSTTGMVEVFAEADIAPLTDDERARYAAVTQQTTLGMGNIIDAVVNG